jgi:hypothetical protein
MDGVLVRFACHDDGCCDVSLVFFSGCCSLHHSDWDAKAWTEWKVGLLPLNKSSDDDTPLDSTVRQDHGMDMHGLSCLMKWGTRSHWCGMFEDPPLDERGHRMQSAVRIDILFDLGLWESMKWYSLHCLHGENESISTHVSCWNGEHTLKVCWIDRERSAFSRTMMLMSRTNWRIRNGIDGSGEAIPMTSAQGFLIPFGNPEVNRWNWLGQLCRWNFKIDNLWIR